MYSVTHVCNSEIKQLSPLFFTMLWDIHLIFGLWVYNDKLRIKFTFRSNPMIFGQVMALGLWNLAKYLHCSCHHFFSLCFEILTWCLVYECIMMSYRSSLHFVPVHCFLAELWLWNLAKYLVVTTLFHYDLRYWLDFWYESV